jgi:phage major head subunit gpT-like protein
VTTGFDYPAFFATANTVVHSKFDDIFGGGYESPSFPVFAEVVPGLNAQTLENNVIGPVALLREWTGMKQIKSVRGYKNSAETKAYEATMGFRRRDLIGAGGDMVLRRLAELPVANRGGMERLASEYLTANPTGYDGVALYSASHPHADAAGNVQSNLTALDLSYSGLEQAQYTASLLTLENGDPADISIDTIEVGPKLLNRALDLAEAESRTQSVNQDGVADSGWRVAAAPIHNVFKGRYTVIENKRLTGFTWRTYDSSKAAKPVIVGVNRAFELIKNWDMESYERFMNDTLLTSVEGDLILLAGDWHVTQQHVGTA